MHTIPYRTMHACHAFIDSGLRSGVGVQCMRTYVVPSATVTLYTVLHSYLVQWIS